jgi:hypothetical protein
MVSSNARKVHILPHTHVTPADAQKVLHVLRRIEKEEGRLAIVLEWPDTTKWRAIASKRPKGEVEKRLGYRPNDYSFVLSEGIQELLWRGSFAYCADLGSDEKHEKVDRLLDDSVRKLANAFLRPDFNGQNRVGLSALVDLRKASDMRDPNLSHNALRIAREHAYLSVVAPFGAHHADFAYDYLKTNLKGTEIVMEPTLCENGPMDETRTKLQYVAKGSLSAEMQPTDGGLAVAKYLAYELTFNSGREIPDELRYEVAEAKSIGEVKNLFDKIQKRRRTLYVRFLEYLQKFGGDDRLSLT